MSNKEIQNDKVQASLIKVETLQKEYEVTLNQYEESVKNYISIIQSTDTNYAVLKERTWWGKSGLKEGKARTKKECETMCANDDKCSGATFNPVKRYCWTRTGDGPITVGGANEYALIPKQTAALNTMKVLNDKLLLLNEEISTELKNINPQVKKQMKEKNNKQKQLDNSYQSLLEQKLEMKRQLQEYSSIEEENENQTLYVNQQSLSMRIWILITALILLVTIRRMYGFDTPSLYITIWLIILIVLSILSFTLSFPSGFVMWSILIMGIILTLINNFLNN